MVFIAKKGYWCGQIMFVYHEVCWTPFTFGFEQVGTNCGLIGQAAVEIDGIAYWMSTMALLDGTVKTLLSSVED